MDLLERIKNDHERQRQLTADIQSTSGDSSRRRELFDQLRTELYAHAAAEEHAFYAELMKIRNAADQSRHSVTEHQEALNILDELADMDMSSPGWLNRFNTLAHDNEHHMSEEEQDVFPLAQELLNADALKTSLLQSFDERKQRELDANANAR